MVKPSFIFKNSNATGADIEHDGARMYELRNTSIERLSWRKLSVVIGHKWASDAIPYFSLRDLHGEAQAGIHRRFLPSVLYLMRN